MYGDFGGGWGGGAEAPFTAKTSPLFGENAFNRANTLLCDALALFHLLFLLSLYTYICVQMKNTIFIYHNPEKRALLFLRSDLAL